LPGRFADEINESLRTVIIAPMTTTMRAYRSCVPLTFQGKRGQVALDQIRAIDCERLVRKLGIVSTKTANAVSATLVQMFAHTGQTYSFLL
jgi:mRNA interferase MazF